MEIIFHRRNTVEQLISTPDNYGVEIDLRTYDKKLIINHDPFKKGIKFSKWLSFYKHGTLILNIKEEGIEEEVLFYLDKFQIETYFFLDQSLPIL